MGEVINTRMAAYQGLEEMTKYKDLKHLNPGKDAMELIAKRGDEYAGRTLASGIHQATSIVLQPSENALQFSELAYNARHAALTVLANGMGGTLGATMWMIGKPLLDGVTQHYPEHRSDVLHALGSAVSGYGLLYYTHEPKGVKYDMQAIYDSTWEAAFATVVHTPRDDAAFAPTVYLRSLQTLRPQHAQEAAAIGRDRVKALLDSEKSKPKAERNHDKMKALEAANHEPGRFRRLFGAKPPSTDQLLELQEKAFIACGARISPAEAPS
jgi:hypothetical protein